jgi:hypothetical protein
MIAKIGTRLDFWGWTLHAAAVQERLGYQGKHKRELRRIGTPQLNLGRNPK